MDNYRVILKTIFEKSSDYAVLRWNQRPSSILINEDGSIEIVLTFWLKGYIDNEYHTVSLDDIFSSEEEIQIKKEEDIQQKNKQQIAKQLAITEKEKIQYEYLKKKFDN